MLSKEDYGKLNGTTDSRNIEDLVGPRQFKKLLQKKVAITSSSSGSADDGDDTGGRTRKGPLRKQNLENTDSSFKSDGEPTDVDEGGDNENSLEEH